jgi:two-component system sensor histidine kinase PilS (NtrC family)
VLRDSGGHPDGEIVIFQDLTRVVEMEERLRRSERLGAVGQLAAGLAHELRNPLASLSGAVELLAADLPKEDESHRRLGGIVRRETARLNRLVSDFLEYAKPEQGGAQVVDVDALLGEVRDLFCVGDHAEIELEMDSEPDLCVLGNPDHLRQATWNLLLNAAQSVPRDGCIRVRAGRTGWSGRDWVEVRVIDNGCGIRPDVLERIFEPFYTTKPKGTGLGLATVHRIVEAHGGQISVKSDPEVGTEIHMLLPAAP